VVDGILDDRTPLHEYEPGTWGPDAAAAVLAHGDRWHDPVVPAPAAAVTAPEAPTAAVTAPAVRATPGGLGAAPTPAAVP
jgi:hypothetical protein